MRRTVASGNGQEIRVFGDEASILIQACAAPEFRPNNEIATATASAKKFEVPVRQAGPAIP